VGYVLENVELEHVDTGIDRVGENFPPGRLFEEALDSTGLVGDHYPELERILDTLQGKRRGRAAGAMKLDEPSQVDVRQRVTGDDEELPIEVVLAELHAARG